MARAISLRAKNTTSPRIHLTEENLRVHRRAPSSQQQSSSRGPERKRQSYSYSYELNDDEDEQSVALRRVASLQALSAYGGCFASGFLAMQQPLPWTTEARSVPTSASGSSSIPEYPDSDLDTQSVVDVQEIETGRRRSWKDFGRSRRSIAKCSRT